MQERLVIAAAMVASCLMLIGGLAYRVLAAPVTRIPLDSGSLQGVPMQIGDWVGQDLPIDPEIEKVIDADAHLSRRYSRRDGRESVSLYLPCGVDAGALLQHIPENCYVGAGWTLVDRRPRELSLHDGRTLPCSVLQLARGGLDMRKLVLLHFLVVDGECFATFSAVARSKGWRHFASVGYAGQVQIVASADNLTVDEAEGLVRVFAVDAAPVIARLFEDLKKGSPLDRIRGAREGR